MMSWPVRQAAWMAAAIVLSAGLVSAAPAGAAGSAWWGVTSGSVPSNLPPGGDGEIVVTVSNLGDAPVTGEAGAVSVTDRLPAGLRAMSITGFWPGWGLGRLQAACQLASLTCTYTPNPNQPPELEGGPITPYQGLEVEIRVKVEAGASSGAENEVSVSGSGVPAASTREPITVNDVPTPFGIESYALRAENEGGSPDTHAGSHPFQLTTILGLNTTNVPFGGEFLASAPEMPKDLSFVLPPGLTGNPMPFPRCTDLQFTTKPPGTNGNSCPANTAVGVAVPAAIEPSFLGPVPFKFVVPVFNLVPAIGEPARFGFTDVGVPVVLDTSVRTGGDYNVVVSAHSIDQTAAFLGSQVTFWGVPGDPRHDNSRGWGCLPGQEGPEKGCVPLGQSNPPPLLTLPTSCTGPLHTSVEGDSWAHPGDIVKREYTSQDSAGRPYGLDECNRLLFNPQISVVPDGREGSTPSGLTVRVHVPQDASLNPNGRAESNVKDTTVTLPEGVALNPAGADGLLACPLLTGREPAQERLEEKNELSGINLETRQPANCPEQSKVATVTIKSPLLPDPLVGEAYLAAQEANPFGSLIALYLVAEDKTAGVLVKLAGKVKPDPLTGQLVSTFKNTPQLPFEDLTLQFFGGSRAPLATPALCGSYTTQASFVPWSFEAGDSPAQSSSTFLISSGPHGATCPNPPGDMSPSTLPFAPSLTAGTTSIQAGGFSPFTMTMSREDGNQDLQAIQLHMPPGLSGLLAGVELCPEPQADQGTCGPNSLIGETTVSVGLGGSPFSVKGGRVYITGPYEGAPFGLSIVNPAKAGPFDLENTPAHHPACDCVVVRAKIEVDPITAALAITTDDTGPYRIPTIIEGIPLQIQHVNVTITRPGFTFNPTNCNPMAITGSLSSAEGASKALSVPFQVTNCATLGFKPMFKVSTAGKTSRKNGASLHVKLVYPKAPFGSQANIAKVKVSLPRQLPSNLPTLQKACPDGTFNSNPAACPAASRIGTADATTPLVPVRLSGPVYFVSHGGANFPELVIVLSGYGVTVDLHAETFISKAGITSSTFRTIPDVPVGTFELTLPQGKYSALAAPGGNLCKEKLKMPTAFTAQNGLVIHQSTKITVTNCPKTRKKVKR